MGSIYQITNIVNNKKYIGSAKNFLGRKSRRLNQLRINNSKGYIKGNIILVHKDVNIIRNKYSIDYFIKICKSIANKF